MESKVSLTCENGVAKIELCGSLDANNAPALQDQLKQLIGQPINDIVFSTKDLEYLSSAGLRVIVFAKQKIGANSKLYLIAPQEAVLEVVKMSGLTNYMEIKDTYEG